MSKKLKGNAAVGQSGGPTGVINQSLVGVIEEVGAHDCFDRLLGAVHGIVGIKQNDFADLTKVAQNDLEAVAQTPSAALGSTRQKPKGNDCEQMFEVFRQNDVRYFFYIGGNDSASTANMINDLAQKAGYELNVFHVPKTIDNDLRVTDHCPGYGTAATFVSHAVIGDDLDNQSLPGVKIDIVMGRNAGWLTASAMLARRAENDGPHLIYVPEKPVSLDQMRADVADVYGRLGRCLVVVSEGVTDPSGEPIATLMVQNAEVDEHGNKQLSGSGALADYLTTEIKKGLPEKSRVRADTFGYLQRCFPGVVSAVDSAEARTCGRMAVRYAAEGNDPGSVALRRLGNGAQYGVETFLTELSSVAVDTKPLPAEYISDAGNNIDESFRDYVLPLVGDLPTVGRLRR